ncbi:MAG: fabZ [Acidobacteria bacterium]|nr:fabZ [Acidobacteriota bacterium]
MSWLSNLPHQIPFRAASDARRIDDKTIEGEFVCTANDPLSLEIMVVEAMAQVAGGIAFEGKATHAYLTGIDRCTVTRPIIAGDVVRIRVALDAAFGAIYRFSGTGSVDGLECVSGRFYLAEPDA